MTTPLKIDQLCKKYGNLCAVNKASFEVREGEVFGLLGPNGAGKTSIISCITGLEQASSGEISVFGEEVSKNPRACSAVTGVVPQEIINHGYFSVEEILQFHSGYYGYLRNTERIHFLLKRLALWEHRNKKVKQLSGGMKRRLMIAKSLVHWPRLLLLDEPTAGVDIELRANLWDFVRELKEQGISVLLTTHYIEEAEELCDRVGILQHGRMRRCGETQALIKELTKRRFVIHLRQPVETISHLDIESQDDEKLVISVPSNMGAGDLMSQLNIDLHLVRDISIQEGKLEDVLHSVLGASNVD
ncbi:MAG: ATPase [Waddliaceae bacterium]|nr:ATPase [Waddliaceae bacterium]